MNLVFEFLYNSNYQAFIQFSIVHYLAFIIAVHL